MVSVILSMFRDFELVLFKMNEFLFESFIIYLVILVGVYWYIRPWNGRTY
jgi:hypothetical protein